MGRLHVEDDCSEVLDASTQRRRNILSSGREILYRAGYPVTLETSNESNVTTVHCKTSNLCGRLRSPRRTVGLSPRRSWDYLVYRRNCPNDAFARSLFETPGKPPSGGAMNTPLERKYLRYLFLYRRFSDIRGNSLTGIPSNIDQAQQRPPLAGMPPTDSWTLSERTAE
jgi:hypothetical protein